MTAHDKAINLMANAIEFQEDEYSGSPSHQLALVALAAITDSLLVDLLVERGVLEPVTLPHGNHTTHTYQRKNT